MRRPKWPGATTGRWRWPASRASRSSSPSRSGERSRFGFRRLEALAQAGEEIRRRPSAARERRVVDFEKAETRAESLEPLEVVNQRPVEIAGDRRTGRAAVC